MTRPSIKKRAAGLLRSLAKRLDPPPVDVVDLLRRLDRAVRPVDTDARPHRVPVADTSGLRFAGQMPGYTLTDGVGPHSAHADPAVPGRAALDCALCQTCVDLLPTFHRQDWPSLLIWLGRGPVGQRCALHINSTHEVS